MSKCENIQDRLSDYRTGLLSERERVELESHTSVCDDCTYELNLLDSVLSIVEENTAPIEPPAGLWNGVYNRITDPQPERQGLAVTLRRWLWTPVRAAGVGVAVLAIAAGLYVSAPRPRPVSSASMAPADEYVLGHVLYIGQGNLADRTASMALFNVSVEN